MKRLLLLLIVLGAFIFQTQAQTDKRYGFTATIRVPNTKKEVLLDSTLSWVKATLPPQRFTSHNIDETENLIAGRGSFTDDAGTTNFDLTFYFKDNLVDMVADNVAYSQLGRLPKKERTKGTPKQRTKTYLTKLSSSLEKHLTSPQL
ncbi:hypothetical protein [Adhaeribacter aquaticus]|uniref:hypothetical protein n=1 Tax=Adhaeribacter aquaticus TaxID=299567 RepID=UPI000403D0A9|nr:hypothetical protein [Adhaeribacter aquaticus]